MFEVTPDEVQGTSTYARNTASMIDSTLKALKNYVLNLDGEWRGFAATEFQTLMQNWDTNALHLNTALNGIADGLGTNAVNYSHFEVTNHHNLAGISASLPPLAI